MLFVAKLGRGEHQLALFLDIGLVGAVHHDVRDVRVGQQLFQRAEAQQLVDEHLFQRELLPPVEREFQFGEHLHDDRPEFLRQLFLVERGGRFRIDTLQQAREHLLLDLVYGGLEPLATDAGLVDAIGPLAEPVHGIAGCRGRRVRYVQRIDRRELFPAGRRRIGRFRVLFDWRRAARHRACHAKAGPTAAGIVSFAESAHRSRPGWCIMSGRGYRKRVNKSESMMAAMVRRG